ncbi:MAG: hypothetical protein DRP29_01995 [Thermodesulfobacteriota bacterium]|nr:MAG: hypothetical protein DRP29_01995 [Thermodesulfobacteriota bacterium]
MGGFGRVISSVVSVVVGFVTRKGKSYKNSLAGVWQAIRDIWDKMHELWEKVKKYVEEKLDPIIKFLKKLEKWYKKYLEPWIRRIDKLLNTYIKLYLAWKIVIERKITYLFNVIDQFLRPKVLWLDNFLRHLQQVVSVVSKSLAAKIESVRRTIYKYTLDLIYRTEKKIVRYVHQVFVPIDRFVYGLQALKQKHIDPLAQGLKGLSEDISKIIDKKSKPRPTFSADVVDTGLKEFWNEYLRTHPTPHVYVGPPVIDIEEIYKELEATTSEDPDKLPPEEKEIYEALEEEVKEF